MTIDLCPFYCELDLLLLRLHQHSFVDKFYIWEFDRDFQGKIKPTYFKDNLKLFDQFKDRIIYRHFDYLPGNTPQERAKNYRDIILTEIRQFNDFDVIINTDTDEILKSITGFSGGITATQMSWYVYYMNYYGGKWTNGSICTVKDLKDKSLFDLRYNFHSGRRKWKTDLLLDCGWHFSWLGTHEQMKDKYRNFGQGEGWTEKLLDEAYFNEIREKRIRFWNGLPLQLVEIDNSFPEYLFKNQNKFKQYIYEPQSDQPNQ